MAFTVTKSGQTYHLHERRETVKGGQEVTLYFFFTEPCEGAIDAVPSGYEVHLDTPAAAPVLRQG